MFIIFEKKQMKNLLIILTLLFFINISCESNQKEMKKIVFLHHSTGRSIWLGNTNRYIYKLTKKGDVQKFFTDYNKKNKTNYKITEIIFPKKLHMDGIIILMIIIISGLRMQGKNLIWRNQLLKFLPRI